MLGRMVMDEQHGIESRPPVELEINTSHRYRADEMGVIEFRIRNQGDRLLKALDLVIECPCEKARTKSASLKNLTPRSEKKPSFQFEPARGGEALLEIEVCAEDEDRLPLVFRGQASVTISSKNEGSTSNTSFTLDIHDIDKFMGNDLSQLLGGAGKQREINAERLNERMERKEAFWMRVDLEFDEHETFQRRTKVRHVLYPPPGQTPAKTMRAMFESLDPTTPRRIFVYSMPELRFGREPRSNDAVLRFLPDFFNDQRSKTISGEQFLVRYDKGECKLAMAEKGHALMTLGGNLVRVSEQIPLSGMTELKIGTCEFTLKISCVPRAEDSQWKRTREEIVHGDPGCDAFEASRWDVIDFSRPTNGPEEEYVWLLHKSDLGWNAAAGSTLQLVRPEAPCARLAYWNGRYYLEALDSRAEIIAGGSALPPGKVLCLGAETEIDFGPLRFQWMLL
jgi:hypothetical protein